MEKTLGQRILEYRAEHRLTQTEMAIKLGTYPTMIYRLESGRKPHKARACYFSKLMDKLEKGE